MSDSGTLDAERARLGDAGWRRWGPFVADRAWGTVREDYSADGEAWTSFPHDHARSQAYRWNEDGLAAVCDRDQLLCLGLALWNGADPILKERPFGLTGPEGNHGEDVKECYWHLDATPTHSWLRWRYHYPQGRFPYDELVAENARRGQDQPEFELLDTGAFQEGRFWVVDVTYAKAAPDDICLAISVTNAGAERATLHVLPHVWFRNTWAWCQERAADVPSIEAGRSGGLVATPPALGPMTLAFDVAAGPAQPLFCDNETNTERLYGVTGHSAYPKDGINDHVVSGAATVSPVGVGTKAAVWHQVTLDGARRPSCGCGSLPAKRRRISADGFASVVATRSQEADAFWDNVSGLSGLDDEGRAIVRQTLAGLLWSQQYYHYNVRTWLYGDRVGPQPPVARLGVATTAGSTWTPTT